MDSFEQKLEKYAELAVKVGVNLQPGQQLLVNSPLSSAEFTRKVVKKAYEAGAKNVHVEWTDDEVLLIKYLNAPEDTFKEYPMWKAKGLLELAQEGAAFLTILAPNPDLLKDVKPERIATANKTASIALEDYRQYTRSSRVSWAIVATPTKEWADKLFPDLQEEEKNQLLWENIFKATRVNTADPVKAWKDHVENLNRRLNYLNNRKYKKLHYKAPGTDLTVELPEGHIWEGGGTYNEKGTYFVPNMPTEEIFTMPSRNGVNGTVTSTKPLNYSSTIIDEFSLTFENGRIVDFSAKQGYETLKKLIETDEGSHYLGEIALVPYDSPISKTNIVFYNTLFDENASCHFAIGAAYPTCIKGGKDMNKEELENHGANTSLTHVDFMVGSEKLAIDGETEVGVLEPIFRRGNWV